MPFPRARFLAIAVVFLVITACSPSSVSLPTGDLPAPDAVLLAGTPYETPVYVFDSAKPGPTVLVLGGVHGDEPGGWQAAETLVLLGPPARGRLIVVPRANAIAVEDKVRSTPTLGDLNRLYGTDPDVLPMAGIANAIVGLVRQYEVDAVIDLHESWEPFSDGSTGDDGSVDTSAIGQTVAGDETPAGRALARDVVRRANELLTQEERLVYYKYPPGYEEQVIVPLPPAVPASLVSNESALFIAELVPGTVSLLVEVSQQQSLERRIRQQVIVVDALLKEL